MTMSTSSPIPARPGAERSTKPLSLAPWETRQLPGGDVAVLAILPEVYASALAAQAELQKQSLGEYFAELIGRASEYGWL